MVQPQKVRHKKSDGTRFNAHLSIKRAAIFSPLGKKHKNPQCTHCDSSSSIGKWISRTQTLVPLRAREGNQSDRFSFLSFLFFFSSKIHSNRIVNKLATQPRTGSRFSWKKKEETPRDFPVSQTFREPCVRKPCPGGGRWLEDLTIWPSRRLSAGDVINSLQPRQFVGTQSITGDQVIAYTAE